MPPQIQEFEAPAPLAPPPEPPAAPSFSAAAPADEDFGFDFDDTEPAPQTGATAGFGGRPAAYPPPEPTAETEEDLWSEVSLRDRGTDLLEAPAPAVAGSWPGPAEVLEETADLSADETIFEEVSAARAEPPPAAVAPEALPEPRPAPVSATAGLAAPAVDPAEIERIVASRLEEAVRQVLAPLIAELARKTLEEVAWEVIPDLAEAMIRAEIERVRQATSTG
jgi:hypothetical protein